jgi:hypothetical protein
MKGRQPWASQTAYDTAHVLTHRAGEPHRHAITRVRDDQHAGQRTNEAGGSGTGGGGDGPASAEPAGPPANIDIS